MRKLVKNNVSWVGKIDWELEAFHGNEYSTHHGSTYNSYLIEEEKTVLMDGVWLPFADEFVRNLESEIAIAKVADVPGGNPPGKGCLMARQS